MVFGIIEAEYLPFNEKKKRADMKKRFSITYQNKTEGAQRRFAIASATGFLETAFPLSGETLRPEEIVQARAAGLTVESLRLPSDGVNLLWAASPEKPRPENALPSDTPETDDSAWQMLKQIYASYFNFAMTVGVTRVILTPTLGTGVAPVSQAGLARFRALAAMAREKGVRLLIENDQSAPHFEAAVRVVCDGFHGVSFAPARAWRYFKTSAIPPYATAHLLRISLDDERDGEFGYLPKEGETDFGPLAKSLAPLHFRGTLAVSPDAQLPLYRDLDTYALSMRAYDRLCTVLHLFKKEEGVV